MTLLRKRAAACTESTRPAQEPERIAAPAVGWIAAPPSGQESGVGAYTLSPMLTYRFAILFVAGVSVLAAGATAAQSPSAAAGRSIWAGVFTDAQAERGRGYYAEHCATCHGADLRGAESKALVDRRFWSDWQETTVDYLFTQISRNMPFSDDGSLAGKLPRGVYVDIVAHILKSNGFPAGAQELSPESAAGVAIVHKEGSRDLPADALAHVVGCLTRTGSDWQLVKASRPVRVLASGGVNKDEPLGDRTITLRFVLTPLQKFVGHRISATGRLIEDGGAGGLNVTNISSLAPTCE